MGWLTDTFQGVTDTIQGVGEGAGALLSGDLQGAWDGIWVDAIQGGLERTVASFAGDTISLVGFEEGGENIKGFLDEWGVEIAAAAVGGYYFGGPLLASISGGAGAGAGAGAGGGGGLGLTKGIGYANFALMGLSHYMKYKERKSQAELAKLDARRMAQYTREMGRRDARDLERDFRTHQADLTQAAHATQLTSGGIVEGTGTAQLLSINRARAQESVQRILKDSERQAKQYEERIPGIDRSRRYGNRADILDTGFRAADNYHRYFYGQSGGGTTETPSREPTGRLDYSSRPDERTV